MQILMKLHLDGFKKKKKDTKFHEHPSSGSRVIPWRQTDLTDRERVRERGRERGGERGRERGERGERERKRGERGREGERDREK